MARQLVGVHPLVRYSATIPVPRERTRAFGPEDLVEACLRAAFHNRWREQVAEQLVHPLGAVSEAIRRAHGGDGVPEGPPEQRVHDQRPGIAREQVERCSANAEISTLLPPGKTLLEPPGLR